MLDSPVDEPTDVALMLRVRADDEHAFAELYRRHCARVLSFFHGLSRNDHTASDLCQETFVRIWTLRRRYAATGAFPAYLMSVARHIWLEHSRESRKAWRLGWPVVLSDVEHLIESGSHGRPDDSAQLSEIQRHVFDAMAELPEDQQMAFVLRMVSGLSNEEIAQVMECPVNTVRSRKLLAIKKLRDALRGLLVL